MASIDKTKAKANKSGGTGHSSKPKPKASGGTGHSSDPHKMVQFYDHVKKDPQMEKLYNYPNKKDININLPARFLICSPTGGGKTTTALQIIKSIGVFESIIIIAKMKDEPLYELLKDYSVKKSIDEDVELESIFILSDTLDDLPKKDSFDKLSNSLIIIDDYVNSKAAELKNVLDLWIMGRKLSISMIWITQSFFRTNQVIRENVQYIILKKLVDQANLKRILALYKLDTDPELVLKMCKSATNTADTTQFFMIDTLTADPNLRFRHCFKGFPQIVDESKTN
jgi:hypothetical protein